MVNLLKISALSLLLVGCNTTNSTESYCDRYKIQAITSGDSKEEQMRKLSENTYYQGVCN